MNDAARDYFKRVASLFWRPREVEDIVAESGIAPADVNWAQPSIEQWRDVVSLALRTGKFRDLHDVIAGRLVGVPEVGSRLDELSRLVLSEPYGGSSWYHSVDPPWLARLVGPYAQRAVFDRRDLRSFCESMIHGMPVVFIVGEPRSGKSHSWHLIRHVAAEKRYEAILVDVADAARYSRHYTAISLIRDIADQLGVALDIPNDTEGNSPPRCLLNKLFGRLPEDGKRRWLFIDGVDRPNVTESAQVLVGKLAEAVERTERQGIQLAVTGYAEPLTQNLPGAGFERIKPIGRPEIELFFRDTAAHLQVEVSDEIVGALMDRLYDGLGEQPDLGILSRKAAELARCVLGGRAA